MTTLARIEGCATVAATRAWAERQREAQPGLEPAAFRELTGTGLTVAKVGYGAYRVHVDDPEHRDTLTAAIRRGCNSIDTSSNYTDGGSERLIGAALRDLIDAGEMTREELVLISKVGYLQGANLEHAMQRQRDGDPWPDVVHYQDGCWHCIHADFLADQLDRSLERLQCAALDVYLLHNPEYFFSDAKHRAGSAELPALRDEFYRRVEGAFTQFERFIQEGRLSYYGISSNTFPNRRDDFETVSLDLILEAARNAAAKALGNAAAHHFKVLQLPYNLFESGALTELNTLVDGALRTVLDAAAAWGVGVLVNRPLNAIRGQSMTRLAMPAVQTDCDFDADLREHLQALQERESDMRHEMRTWPEPPQALQPNQDQQIFFNVGEVMSANMAHFSGGDHWESVLGQVVAPSVQRGMQEAIRLCPPDRLDDWKSRQETYAHALNDVFAFTQTYLAWRAAQQMKPLDECLAASLPAEARGATLSQKALQFVASSPGVAVVLNGMKRRPYVDDALGILRMPAYHDVLALADAARETL